MYEIIKKLRPYFHSLREIESNVILDMKLPYSWNFEDIVSSYSSIKLLVQDKNEKFTLVSIICNATAEGYETAFSCAKNIITINKENEEKQKLLQSKIKELEMLFQHQSLDKLRDLSFIENARQEDTTGIRMVDEGGGEGQLGNQDHEEPND